MKPPLYLFYTRICSSVSFQGMQPTKQQFSLPLKALHLLNASWEAEDPS